MEDCKELNTIEMNKKHKKIRKSKNPRGPSPTWALANKISRHWRNKTDHGDAPVGSSIVKEKKVLL